MPFFNIHTNALTINYIMKQNKNEATEIQVITVGETTFPVEVRNGRIAVNLTAMGKLYGKQKQPSNWLRTDEAQRYLDALAKLQKCGLADLVEVKNGGTPGLNGTWCYDRRIAVRYAQFLDEYLSIQVDTLLVDAMEGRKFIVSTTQFEGNQYVSLEDFCKAHSLSPNVFYAYKAHYPYEYIWTGGTWRMSTRLCRYIELQQVLNQDKQNMYDYKKAIDSKQAVLDFQPWED